MRERIDPRRLLVYRIQDGWEPLCAFLGAPVPATAFPWVNDARSFQRRQRLRLVRGIAIPLVLTAATAASAVLVARRIRRGRGCTAAGRPR